jgi:cysteine desulfurase / selenocysteine lyase
MRATSRAGGWSAGRSASCLSTCRLWAAISTPFQRPQGLRAHGHRRALRQASAARGHAAVPGRRRHDQLRHLRKDDLQRLPYKFEAGTPDIAGAIGLGAALEYISGWAWTKLQAHEHDLLAYATEKVGAMPGVRLIGTARERAGVLSFVMDGVHPHDLGTILDREGIAIRTGHHCAQPVMERFGIPATARASFAVYNTREDVDALVEGIRTAREVFA